jgi:hypothetical protein
MSLHSGFTFHSGFAVRFISTLCGAVLALVLSSSALAADSAPEIKAAATHAGFASQADNIKGVHTHLHHTLNCLVGPKGDGFDSNEMNPCANMGNGAIPDNANDNMMEVLDDAVDKTNSGLETDDVDKAKAAAASVKKMLTLQ